MINYGEEGKKAVNDEVVKNFLLKNTGLSICNICHGRAKLQ